MNRLRSAVVAHRLEHQGDEGTHLDRFGQGLVADAGDEHEDAVEAAPVLDPGQDPQVAEAAPDPADHGLDEALLRPEPAVTNPRL